MKKWIKLMRIEEWVKLIGEWVKWENGLSGRMG